MAAHMGSLSSEDNDANPAADRKMGTNVKNPTLSKTAKKEKEWCQTLPDGRITLQSNICLIVTVKSLDSSIINCKIQVELAHADTSVVGFNILVVLSENIC